MREEQAGQHDMEDGQQRAAQDKKYTGACSLGVGLRWCGVKPGSCAIRKTNGLGSVELVGVVVFAGTQLQRCDARKVCSSCVARLSACMRRTGSYRDGHSLCFWRVDGDCSSARWWLPVELV